MENKPCNHPYEFLHLGVYDANIYCAKCGEKVCTRREFGMLYPAAWSVPATRITASGIAKRSFFREMYLRERKWYRRAWRFITRLWRRR